MRIEISNCTINITEWSDEFKEQIMVTIADVKSEIEALKASTAAAIARVADDVAFLKSKFENNQATPAELDAIVASLGDIKSSLDGVDPVADNPPVPTPTA